MGGIVIESADEYGLVGVALDLLVAMWMPFLTFGPRRLIVLLESFLLDAVMLLSLGLSVLVVVVGESGVVLHLCLFKYFLE